MASDNSSYPVVLITGVASGIGLVTAQVLHLRGFSALITDRNPVALAAAKKSLPEDVVVLRADAGSLADANHVAGVLSHRFGRVDFAFFNAGTGRMMPIEAADEAIFDEHFNVTVTGQYFLLQKFSLCSETAGSFSS